MFTRNENNHGGSLSKAQKKVLNETADALKRCECSGDLLQVIDELFEIFKQTQDGKQDKRIRDDEEAELRANNIGVVVIGENKSKAYKICYTDKVARSTFEQLKELYKGIDGVNGIAIVRYDADGDTVEVIDKYYFER